LLHSFQSPTPQAYGGFGRAIAISGGNLLVGDSVVENAYVYNAATGVLERTFSDQWADRGAWGSVVAFAGGNPVIGTQYGPARLIDFSTGALLASMDVPNASVLPSDYAFKISLAANQDLVVAGNPGVVYYPPGGGFRRDSGAVYSFQVPEPATLSLLAAGLGAIWMKRRRKA